MGIESLVTAKAGSVVSENLKVSLATPSASITPSTLTAMIGLSKGGAIALPSATTAAFSSAISALNAIVAAPLNPLNSQATALVSNLQTQYNAMAPSGNPAAFGQLIMQAQAHINDATEVKKASDFLSSSKFSDFGSGVTNMSSLTTQGLNTSFGSLTDAATVMEKAGPIFNTTDMSTFGTGAGLVNKLSDEKLGNSTGINKLLESNGVDLDNISDPVYSRTVDNVLGSVTDETTINTITDQFGVSPYAKIENLKDLTDVSKLVNPASITGFNGDLKSVGEKFSDLGASFESPADASAMLSGMEVPSVPTLDAIPDLGEHVTGMSTDLNSMIGSGSGVPSITDFTGMVTGTAAVDTLTSMVSSPSVGSLTAVQTMLDNNNTLWKKAGVDLTNYTPPTNSLSSCMSFATGLHRMGADTSGSGASELIASLATNDVYGDAIKASLAEGKNRALMQANGISPIKIG